MTRPILLECHVASHISENIAAFQKARKSYRVTAEYGLLFFNIIIFVDSMPF